jgi:hypothetical protein
VSLPGCGAAHNTSDGVRIAPAYVVKKGTHMIIYNRAEEVGKFIEKELL